MVQINSTFYNISTKIPYIESQCEKNIENPSKSNTELVNNFVIEKFYIPSTQTGKSRGLKQLYTPEKLYQLYTIVKLTPSTEDKELQDRFREAKLALKFWKNRHLDIELTRFLEHSDDLKKIFEEDAPNIPSSGIKAIHAMIVLQLLSDEGPNLELLKTVKPLIETSKLEQHIRNEENAIRNMRQELVNISRNNLLLVPQDNTEIRKKEEMIEQMKVLHSILLSNKASTQNTLLYQVKFLFSLFTAEQTKDLHKAYKGLLKYIEYLLDEEREIKLSPTLVDVH